MRAGDTAHGRCVFGHSFGTFEKYRVPKVIITKKSLFMYCPSTVFCLYSLNVAFFLFRLCVFSVFVFCRGGGEQDCVVRVVQAYITSMVGCVDVICQDQSLDDPLEDGASTCPSLVNLWMCNPAVLRR